MDIFVAYILCFTAINLATAQNYAVQNLQSGNNLRNCVPDIPNSANTFFYLFRREDPDNHEILSLDPASVSKSSFKIGNPVVIYTHGFIDSGIGDGATAIKNAYMERNSDDNIIVLDWCNLATAAKTSTSMNNGVQTILNCHHPEINFRTAKQWPYQQAVCNTAYVGKYLADFLKMLIDNDFALKETIHLIGHSLGSHVSGIAGHIFQIDTRERISRITGLDPTMPYFVGVPDEDRLDHSDAIFVDVIHTAGRKTLPISNYPWSLAFLEPMGHVDFYPNNGKAVQPGCSFYDVIGTTCSHSKAWEFYAESVLDGANFGSCKCSNWEDCGASVEHCEKGYHLMGKETPQLLENPLQNWFYLETNEKKPYGQGSVQTCVASLPELKHQQTSDAIWELTRFNDQDRLVFFNLVNSETRLPQLSSTYHFRGSWAKEARRRNVWGPHECLQPSQQPYCKYSYPGTHLDDFHSGRERGHLTSFLGNAYSQDAADKTFSCGNAAPQDKWTNQQAWRQVEARAGAFAKVHGEAYIITGVCSDNLPIPGNSGIEVPSCFWKFVCASPTTKSGGKAYVGAFIADNREPAVTSNPGNDFLENILTEHSFTDLINRSGANLRDLKYVANIAGNFPVPNAGFDNNLCFPNTFAETLPLPKFKFGDVDPQYNSIQFPASTGLAVASKASSMINNIFGQDYQFTYRAALTLTNFGEDISTFDDAKYDGIWKISESDLATAKLRITPHIKNAIWVEHGINWDDVEHVDMLKPLHCGIAARILYSLALPQGPALTIAKQNDQFKTIYGSHDNNFQTGVIDYYNENPARGKYDLIVVLDGSGSIGAATFEVAKQMTWLLIQSTLVNTNHTRIGLVVFSSASQKVIELNNNLPINEIQRIILNYPYPGGGTMTHEALDDAVGIFNIHGKFNVPHVAIVITDGASNNAALTVAAAGRLRANNIETFSIGIGSGINQNELLVIAGNDRGRVVMADSYQDLSEMHLWLNLDDVPLTLELDVPLNETLLSGEVRNYRYEVPVGGLTFELTVEEGTVDAYYSFNYQSPSAELHEGKLSPGLTFLKAQNNGSSVNAIGSIYIGMFGATEKNDYELVAHPGRVEGCGFIGINQLNINISPVVESLQEGSIIWSNEIYGYNFRSTVANTDDYLTEDIQGSYYILSASPAFSNFLKTEKTQILTHNISFMCGGGTEKTITLNIGVFDQNTETPQLESRDSMYAVSYPVNINQTVTKPGDLKVIDEDISPVNTLVSVYTTNPDFIVVEEEGNNGSEDGLDFLLSLKVVRQIEQGSHEVIIHADDGKFVSNLTLTIIVE